jgi:predicted nucleic acid-binding protein
VLDLARDGLLYLDTSALLKLLVDEDESAALRAELGRWDDNRFVTSALTRVELPRAVRRVVPPVLHREAELATGALLESVQSVPMSDAIINLAAALDPPVLRSLDAVHLASALVAAPAGALPVLCGYDSRLQDAGRDRGLLTISPA